MNLRALTYQVYLNEENTVALESPLRKIGLNGMICSGLAKKGVHTVADLLEIFKKKEMHLITEHYNRSRMTKWFKTKLEDYGFKVEE